jgi:hypothetical protein
LAGRAGHRARTVVGLAVAVGLSAWASVTVPFTSGADAVTAVGFGLVATEVAIGWRRPAPGTGWLPGDRARPRWWPWLALGAALVALELVSFFLGPRVDHPTVSSLYDSATRWRAVKAACFFGWLCLGAAVVRS